MNNKKKILYMLQFLFFYKCCSSKNPNESKILSSTNVFNIDDNIYWAHNRYIRMISDGSCDTENWSNDAENSALLSEIYIMI